MGFVYLVHIFLYFALYLITLLTYFLCMTLPDMRLTFIECREASRHAREATINYSTPNPARAMDRALLATAVVATSSGDATTLTATHGTLLGQSP